MKKITFIAILLLCICSLTKAKEKVISKHSIIPSNGSGFPDKVS